MAKKKNELNEYFEEYYDVSAKTVNAVITSIYKPSDLELKILTYVFSNLDTVQRREDAYYFEFHTSKFMKLISANYKSGSYYSRLKEAAKGFTGLTMGFEDPVNHRFGFFNVINSATYADGKMTLKFNKDIGDSILFNFKKGFTSLPLLTMLQFKSVYAMRLYSLLKSVLFLKHTVTYGVSELKLTLGVINTKIDAVQRVLDSKKNLTESDYDLAVAKSPEKMYDEWGNFKKRVIDVAVNEINDTSDITVTYTPVRTGRGGKITGITFKIELDKKDRSENLSLSDDEKLLFYDKIREKILKYGVNITTPEARIIAKEADFNEDRIKRAIILVFEGTEPNTLKNPVGYIIAAIRENYWASRKQLERYRNRYFGKNKDDKDDGDVFIAEDTDGQLEIIEIVPQELPCEDEQIDEL